jgi:NADPH2:quinone reductase
MATPRKLRLKIWQRIATDLKPSKLNLMVAQTVPFEALPKVFQPLLDGKQTGRTLIRIR